MSIYCIKVKGSNLIACMDLWIWCGRSTVFSSVRQRLDWICRALGVTLIRSRTKVRKHKIQDLRTEPTYFFLVFMNQRGQDLKVWWRYAALFTLFFSYNTLQNMVGLHHIIWWAFSRLTFMSGISGFLGFTSHNYDEADVLAWNQWSLWLQSAELFVWPYSPTGTTPLPPSTSSSLIMLQQIHCPWIVL